MDENRGLRPSFCAILVALIFSTVTGSASASAARAAAIVPSADLMTIGAYYYPEAWPESQWERDLDGIAKMGLEFVHMGEFAWLLYEPEPELFDFTWLDRAVALAGARGLKVVLCTPSAAPPVWLTRSHPEMLMVAADGRRQNHGSRAHACWNVPEYRNRVERVVAALEEHYHGDTRVVGWQIDNELSHYGKDFCYCTSCRDTFHRWLRQRYRSIEELNRAWGTNFWSQGYTRFDEIDLPNPQELPQAVNPHAMLDLRRWFAESAAEYIRFQAGLLRKHGDRQWVTTNFMTWHSAVAPALSANDLDIATSTLYPVVGYQSDDRFRIGDEAGMSLMHDYLRGLNGNFGVMELQPGQVNWGPANTLPEPGAIRLWIMRAFAAGAKLVCTYRYRQPLSGAELYHSGLVLPDGVTLSDGGRQFAQAMKDLRLLRANARPGAAEPARYAKRRAAIVIDPESRWDIDQHPQTNRWNTLEHWFRWYRGLKALGAPVDAITNARDFSRYPFLVVPAHQLADDTLVARLRAYAEAGGHLIVTCRTAHKDRDGHLWEGPWSRPILSLIGARVRSYDVLPMPRVGRVRSGDEVFEWGSWAEQLEPETGTKVLATYEDQFYRGAAAAVTRAAGNGSVTYVGVDSLSGELEEKILREVFTRAGVAAEDLPPHVVIDWRDGLWIATNFDAAVHKIAIPDTATILLGARDLPPCGVTVWRE